MTANAFIGNTDLTPQRPVTVPSPASRCPQCGNVEIKSAQYLQRDTHLVFFACADGHEWLTRWNEVA